MTLTNDSASKGLAAGAGVMRRLAAVVPVLALLATFLVVTALTTGPASAAYPGADGKIVLVKSNQVYTISASGSGLTKLTSSGKNYKPRWSPNGRRIAYINEPAAGVRDVWVMSASGANKQRVTRLGNVTSNLSWSPDGRWIAFATNSLYKVGSAAPFGTPQLVRATISDCYNGPRDEVDLQPVPVDGFLAWSPTGSEIAVFNHYDAYFDDALYKVNTVTQRADCYDARSGDCCGYYDWRDLFWGPAGQFGYSEAFLGDYGDVQHPSHIVYPGFTSAEGDTGGAPSPSGRSMALTNASSGSARVYITNAAGGSRRLLTSGYQPDWQPLP